MLFGNHDVWNILGDVRYRSPLETANPITAATLARHQLMLRIEDSDHTGGIVLVHGEG